MPVVKVKENESFEQAMRRFKKTCEKAGIPAPRVLRQAEHSKKEEGRRRTQAGVEEDKAHGRLSRPDGIPRRGLKS
jgi:small subunit ribosomal protein S21